MDCPRCGDFNSSTVARCVSCGARLRNAKRDDADIATPEPALAAQEPNPAAALPPPRTLASPALAGPAAFGVGVAGTGALVAVLLGRTLPIPSFAFAHTIRDIAAASLAAPALALGALAFLRWIRALCRDAAALSGPDRLRTPDAVTVSFTPLLALLRLPDVLRALAAAVDPNALPASVVVPREDVGYRAASAVTSSALPAPAAPRFQVWFFSWSSTQALVAIVATQLVETEVVALGAGVFAAGSAVLGIEMIGSFDASLIERWRRASAIDGRSETRVSRSEPWGAVGIAATTFLGLLILASLLVAARHVAPTTVALRVLAGGATTVAIAFAARHFARSRGARSIALGCVPALIALCIGEHGPPPSSATSSLLAIIEARDSAWAAEAGDERAATLDAVFEALRLATLGDDFEHAVPRRCLVERYAALGAAGEQVAETRRVPRNLPAREDETRPELEARINGATASLAAHKRYLETLRRTRSELSSCLLGVPPPVDVKPLLDLDEAAITDATEVFRWRIEALSAHQRALLVLRDSFGRWTFSDQDFHFDEKTAFDDWSAANDAYRNARAKENIAERHARERGSPVDRTRTLKASRLGFVTRLVGPESTRAHPIPQSKGIELVRYAAPPGLCWAYVAQSSDRSPRAAVVWAHRSLGEVTSRDFDAMLALARAGLVVMMPTFRGEPGNPGGAEQLYGEVEDALAAADYLASLPTVDPQRMFVAGEDDGGTLALLVAAAARTPLRGAVAIGGDPEGKRALTDTTAAAELAKERFLRAPTSFAPVAPAGAVFVSRSLSEQLAGDVLVDLHAPRVRTSRCAGKRCDGVGLATALAKAFASGAKTIDLPESLVAHDPSATDP